MKKYNLILVASLGFLLVACSDNNKNNNSNNTKNEQATTVNENQESEMPQKVDISALSFNLRENTLDITNTTENQSFKGFIELTYKDINNKTLGWDTVYFDDEGEGLLPQATTMVSLKLPLDLYDIEYLGRGVWEDKTVNDSAITIPFETIHEVNNGPVKSLYLKLVPYSNDSAENLYEQLVEKYRNAGLKLLNVSIFDETYDEPLGESPKDSWEKFFKSYQY